MLRINSVFIHFEIVSFVTEQTQNTLKISYGNHFHLRRNLLHFLEEIFENIIYNGKEVLKKLLSRCDRCCLQRVVTKEDTIRR